MACAYQSDLSFQTKAIDYDGLMDGARNNYPVPIKIRFPVGAPMPRPVIIWHHGGEPAFDGRDRSAEWGDTLAKAGYIVVHVSRVQVTPVQPDLDECTLNGFLPASGTPTAEQRQSCIRWLSQNRYGPQNTKYLLGVLGAFPALFDLTRVAVAGHSAGSIAVQANAGAWQQWGAGQYSERVSGVRAFMGSGMQGPVYAGFSNGFQHESFLPIDRPMLTISGRGDYTGEPSASKSASWLTSQRGDKFMSWANSSDALHETMNINVCDGVVRSQHCTWFPSVGVAFMDAYLRERQEARDWLASDAYKLMTLGGVELHRR